MFEKLCIPLRTFYLLKITVKYDFKLLSFLKTKEYMMALQTTRVVTPEDKLKWTFKMYDKDCSGSIVANELKIMFGTLLEMSCVSVDPEKLDKIVKDAMGTLDVDGNGEVDIYEFVDGCLRIPFLMALICPEMQQQVEAEDE